MGGNRNGGRTRIGSINDLKSRKCQRIFEAIFRKTGRRGYSRYNPISVSGYHIREAGATAAQELAFTLRDGIEYVAWGVDAGLDVYRFVPRMSFFFNAHNDFFEEIAKYRAARRIWAREMKRRFGSNYTRTLQLRFHPQTAGVSLTVQQPLNKYRSRGHQALAGVLGGTQSLSRHRESVRAHQLERLERTRAQRDAGAVANALEKLKLAASRNENTMPATIDAVRAYATLGEICSALRDVYGIYEEPAF